MCEIFLILFLKWFCVKENCLRFLSLLLINYLASVISLKTNKQHFTQNVFVNIFSHSEGCLFVLFMALFAMQKLLNLIRSHLFTFVFIFITLGGGSKRILL